MLLVRCKVTHLTLKVSLFLSLVFHVFFTYYVFCAISSCRIVSWIMFTKFSSYYLDAYYVCIKSLATNVMEHFCVHLAANV